MKTGKYIITEFSGPIVLPPNYSTDDEDEFNAIQILNQDISGWKLQKDKDNIIFESKSPKNPENKRIIMTSGDGKIKKNLSKSFL